MVAGLFNDGPFRTRYYSVATTSNSTNGNPTSTVVVASRCKYLGGWYVSNQIAASANGNNFDVFSITGATTAGGLTAGLLTTIAAAVLQVTSTGTLAIPFGGMGNTAPTGTSSALFLNPGELICTVGTTCQGGYITHVVGEF